MGGFLSIKSSVWLVCHAHGFHVYTSMYQFEEVEVENEDCLLAACQFLCGGYPVIHDGGVDPHIHKVMASIHRENSVNHSSLTLLLRER